MLSAVYLMAFDQLPPPRLGPQKSDLALEVRDTRRMPGLGAAHIFRWNACRRPTPERLVFLFSHRVFVGFFVVSHLAKTALPSPQANSDRGLWEQLSAYITSYSEILYRWGLYLPRAELLMYRRPFRPEEAEIQMRMCGRIRPSHSIVCVDYFSAAFPNSQRLAFLQG